MAIKLIVAMDLNGGIGYKDELLFRVPEDLGRFKKLTTGHIVVMGRKTYESLPNGALLDRINVVVTRNKNYNPQNYKVVVENNIDRIINHYTQTGKQDKDIFIIGGSEIYKQFIPYVDEFHITQIHKVAKNADSYFPIEQVLANKRIFLSEAESMFSDSINSKITFMVYKKIAD